MTKEIAEEDQALEPINQDNADSDDELVKIKAITLDDRIEARNSSNSEDPDQEWQNPNYPSAAEEEGADFEGWDLVPEDGSPGQ